MFLFVFREILDDHFLCLKSCDCPSCSPGSLDSLNHKKFFHRSDYDELIITSKRSYGV